MTGEGNDKGSVVETTNQGFKICKGGGFVVQYLLDVIGPGGKFVKWEGDAQLVCVKKPAQNDLTESWSAFS